jgi:hypothetical protein
MKILVVLMATLTIMFASCKQDSQTDFSGISDPYERWKAYNIQHYSIDQIRACFCPDGGQTMRIEIQSGRVVSVIRLSDSSVVTNASPALYLTVDSLFAIIRNRTTDSLVVTYNAMYGYPEKLDINPQAHPYDGGVLYQTSNLRTR